LARLPCEFGCCGQSRRIVAQLTQRRVQLLGGRAQQAVTAGELRQVARDVGEVEHIAGHPRAVLENRRQAAIEQGAAVDRGTGQR